MPYIDNVLTIHDMYRCSKSIVFFMITSIYTMYKKNNFMYGEYRDFVKKIISKFILYMPYIDKA